MPRKLSFALLILALMLPLIAVSGVSAAQTCSGTTYVVRTGDTLFSISQRFNTTMDAIAATNGITNYDQIYIAQVLCIPTFGTGGPVGSFPSTGSVTQPGQGGGLAFGAAGSTVPAGTLDAQTGYTSTASLTLDTVYYNVFISGCGLVPNSRVSVYVAEEPGNFSGGRTIGLPTDAAGCVAGTAPLPILDYNNRRYYVMAASWNGRYIWGFFDAVPTLQ